MRLDDGMVPATGRDRARRQRGLAWVGVLCGHRAGYRAVLPDGTWGANRGRHYQRALKDVARLNAEHQ